MKQWATAAIVFALGVCAAPAADGPDKPASSPRAPWYKRWFGIGPDAPKEVPKPPRDPAKEALLLRSRAESDLFRRQAVCDEMRRVADETKNDQLYEKANELERMAGEIYRQLTAELPCSRLVPSDEERALDRQLTKSKRSVTDAEEKLSSPSITVPGRRAQANANREIKP